MKALILLTALALAIFYACSARIMTAPVVIAGAVAIIFLPAAVLVLRKVVK